MKTLVFYGSPLQDSHTRALLDAMLEELEGEVKIVDCYRVNVSPCMDCKYCFHKSGCSIKDDMQEIYDYIKECNAVIIATPMHFGTVTGPMLNVFTRLQSFWSSRHIREEEKKDRILPKYGVLAVTTGGKWVNMELIIEGTVDFAFDHMETEQIGSVYAKETDKYPVKNNKKALEKAKYLARQLNVLCRQRELSAEN